MKPLIIRGEIIRLCDAVKIAGEAETGGAAKMLIAEGNVSVNGEICYVKGKTLTESDTFSVHGNEYRITL